MKNADMPAMPIADDCGRPAMYGADGVEALGLTKREMIAASLPVVDFSVKSQFVREVIGRDVNWGDVRDAMKASAEIEAVHRAIRADALLAELERTCQK